MSAYKMLSVKLSLFLKKKKKKKDITGFLGKKMRNRIENACGVKCNFLLTTLKYI